MCKETKNNLMEQLFNEIKNLHEYTKRRAEITMEMLRHYSREEWKAFINSHAGALKEERFHNGVPNILVDLEFARRRYCKKHDLPMDTPISDLNLSMRQEFYFDSKQRSNFESYQMASATSSEDNPTPCGVHLVNSNLAMRRAIKAGFSKLTESDDPKRLSVTSPAVAQHLAETLAEGDTLTEQCLADALSNASIVDLTDLMAMPTDAKTHERESMVGSHLPVNEVNIAETYPKLNEDLLRHIEQTLDRNDFSIRLPDENTPDPTFMEGGLKRGELAVLGSLNKGRKSIFNGVRPIAAALEDYASLTVFNLSDNEMFLRDMRSALAKKKGVSAYDFSDPIFIIEDGLPTRHHPNAMCPLMRKEYLDKTMFLREMAVNLAAGTGVGVQIGDNEYIVIGGDAKSTKSND